MSSPYCWRNCASRVAMNGDKRFRLASIPSARNAASPALPSMPLRCAAATSAAKNGWACFGSDSGAASAQSPTAAIA